MGRRTLVNLILLLTLAACTGAPALPEQPTGTVPGAATATPASSPTSAARLVTQFVADFESALAYYHIPGGAIAIVQGGRLIHAQGYGVRDVATGAPFTIETQFRPGSTGKSMASLMIAQLVDRGLLRWDTPVTQIMPSFKTSDPALTARLTVADLMSMATGLENDERHSLYWQAWTVDDLVRAIAEQPVRGPYGVHYAYNNELYAAAGYVGLAAAGVGLTSANYAVWMRDHVTGPISMTSAVLTDDPAVLTENRSKSYEVTLLGGLATPSVTPDAPVGVIGPAGGWWMNIRDMADYLITQMNGGVTPGGRRIVSTENLAPTWQPGVNIPDQELGGILTGFRYAKGWMVGDYRGVPIRFHGGGWKGYNTMMAVFPEHRMGLLIFTNHVFGSAAGLELMLRFAELLGGLERRISSDLHARFEADVRLSQARSAGFPPYAIDSDLLTLLPGEYEGGWRLEPRDGNRLWLIRPGWEFLLYPLDRRAARFVVGNYQSMGSAGSFDLAGDQVRFSIPDLHLSSVRKK